MQYQSAPQALPQMPMQDYTYTQAPGPAYAPAQNYAPVANYAPAQVYAPAPAQQPAPAPTQNVPATQLLNALSQVEASAVVPAPVETVAVDVVIEQAEEAAQEDPQTLVNALLDIVSQRTGYPIDMLDPTLDLEADLGIDSIKRVEILNSFRKMLPEQKQLELEGGLEELTGTKTLQGIIDWLQISSRRSRESTSSQW